MKIARLELYTHVVKLTGPRTGQSGTTETWSEQNALTSKLAVSRRIDEHVDCTVAVGEPHHWELDRRRRLKRADKTLRHQIDHVRRPEHEERDACDGEDLGRSTVADCAGACKCWILKTSAARRRSARAGAIWSALDTSVTPQCRPDAQNCEK